MAATDQHRDTYNYEFSEGAHGVPNVAATEAARKTGNWGALPPWLLAFIQANNPGKSLAQILGSGGPSWPVFGGAPPAASGPYGPSIGPAPGSGPAASIGGMPTDPRGSGAATSALADALASKNVGGSGVGPGSSGPGVGAMAAVHPMQLGGSPLGILATALGPRRKRPVGQTPPIAGLGSYL